MTHFTSQASEFSPQDSVLNIDASEFVPPGGADEALWWDLMDQQAANETDGALASSHFIHTSHHSSASHCATNHTSLNDPYVDTFDLDAMDFGNVNIGDITTIDDASHHDFSVEHEERSFGHQMTDSNQTMWCDQITPNINTWTSLAPAAVDKPSTSGPVSLPLPVENPFVSVSNHPQGPHGLYLNQTPGLHALVPTKWILLPCYDNASGISHTQQQSSAVLSALMVPPNLPGTTHSQQSSVPFNSQDYDMDASSGLRYVADANADRSPFANQYVFTTPAPFDLPTRAASLEHGRDSLRCFNSYSCTSSQQANSSFGADTPCPGLQALGLEPGRVVNDNYASNENLPVPLDASSTSLVQYTNGAAYAAPASDRTGLSQAMDLSCSNATTRTSNPTSSALPQARRVKRKSAHPVYGPKPLSAHRLKNSTPLEVSGFRNGYSCWAMALQGSNMKRSTARAGKPRTKDEQNARDRGVCPPCRKMKLKVSILASGICLAHHTH